MKQAKRYRGTGQGNQRTTKWQTTYSSLVHECRHVRIALLQQSHPHNVIHQIRLHPGEALWGVLVFIRLDIWDSITRRCRNCGAWTLVCSFILGNCTFRCSGRIARCCICFCWRQGIWRCTRGIIRGWECNSWQLNVENMFCTKQRIYRWLPSELSPTQQLHMYWTTWRT